MRRFAAALVASIVLTGEAFANVQVNDGAILDRRGEEGTKKVEIKTISDQIKASTKGIGCATTTPGKASDVKSPTTTTDASKGGATLQRADPTIASSPAFTALKGTGSSGQGGQGDWTASPRAERTQTQQVLGGIETVQEQIKPNRQVFATMSQGVGQGGTIMEAVDRNSAIRTQTGLTFNQTLQGVAFLAQAFNIANLATAGRTSQATRALTVPAHGSAGPLQTIGLCSAGTTGEGSAARPCVTDVCSSAGASGCVTRRITDAAGNVSYLIEQVQLRALSTPTQLSADELMAAVGQYQSQ